MTKELAREKLEKERDKLSNLWMTRKATKSQMLRCLEVERLLNKNK